MMAFETSSYFLVAVVLVEMLAQAPLRNATNASTVHMISSAPYADTFSAVAAILSAYWIFIPFAKINAVDIIRVNVLQIYTNFTR